MTDQQEPEIHATAASLSPVSPSPVHTAAPLVVPALQDTVDTIEAMVAAVVDAPEALEPVPVLDPATSTNEAADATQDDDIVDDDSFDDAYGQDAEQPQPPVHEPAPQDSNDDYAKMFDSPEGSDQEEDPDASVDVSSAAPVSTSSHVQPGQDNGAPSTAASASASTSTPGELASHDAPAQPAAQPQAGHDAHVPAPAATDAQQDAHSSTPQTAQDEPGAQTSNPESHPTGPAAIQTNLPPNPAASNTSPSTLASASSLPPRPPVANATSQPYSHNPAQDSQQSAPNTQDTPGAPQPHQSRDDYQRLWDQFMADERQYMSEAKWDRFPEGSRLFIGNLSSDKVSKRDVFEIFHRYGRLAQISLKSAYGFVQYHTIEEGARAIQNLENTEVKGRRIHLEISKLQEKTKKERNRSAERGHRGGRDGRDHRDSRDGRDRDGPRKGDRYQNRDGHRGGHHQSPPRQGHRGRDDSYGRDKFHGRNRDRSRSPGYGRQDKGSYRRRSGSPYGRQRRQDKDIDLPRRYGADVPDVQIILQQEVNRDFVGWVESAFKEKGLRPEVMFLHPRFPKDQVIQRQAAEGVHAVVELDMRSQNLGKIPVQVFDRSAGSNNVRFDQYVDLDPGTASEVILRSKAAGAAAASYGQQSYGGYQQQYHAPQQPQGAYGAPHSAAGYSQPPAAAAGIPNIADIAKLVGQVDNATLQRVIAAVAAPAQSAQPAAAPPAGQVDINALLGALGNPAGQAPTASYGAAYGGQAQPPQGPPAPGASNGDAQSSQVQNIMAQLSRYRQ